MRVLIENQKRIYKIMENISQATWNSKAETP